MDSITHIFLGGVIGQAVAGRRVGFGRAFLVGALAATLPDLDVFFHAGDQVHDQALHRQFMHALVVVPVLAAVALWPFLFQRAGRQMWKGLYAAALLACASHTLLDTLTSYGTMILWPFTRRRFSLDIISVVDPLYTVPLIVGVVVAWRWKSRRVAAAIFGVSCLYLGFAAWQHTRARWAQEQLLAARQVVGAENPRVLPQVGAVVSYRSIYIDQGKIYADAIRVPFFGPVVFKQGSAAEVVRAEDLRKGCARAGEDFAEFLDLTDGYLARSVKDPLLIADQRYTYTPEGLEPVWGVRLEETEEARFQITPRWSYFGKLARDLFRPTGYGAMPVR